MIDGFLPKKTLAHSSLPLVCAKSFNVAELKFDQPRIEKRWFLFAKTFWKGHPQWFTTLWKRNKNIPLSAQERVSEQTNEWAQWSAQVKRAVRSQPTSERCERRSERMSEWPVTYVLISSSSESLCYLANESMTRSRSFQKTTDTRGGIYDNGVVWNSTFPSIASALRCHFIIIVIFVAVWVRGDIFR